MAEQATPQIQTPTQATPQVQAPTRASVSTQTVVVNDSDRIKGFSRSSTGDAGALVSTSLYLKPGANRMSKETYAQYASEFKTDSRIWVLDKSFGSLSERDAEALAKQTIDIGLLEIFKAVEKRPRPLAALVEQIKACAGRAKGPESQGGEDDE